MLGQHFERESTCERCICQGLNQWECTCHGGYSGQPCDGSSSLKYLLSVSTLFRNNVMVAKRVNTIQPVLGLWHLDLRCFEVTNAPHKNIKDNNIEAFKTGSLWSRIAVVSYNYNRKWRKQLRTIAITNEQLPSFSRVVQHLWSPDLHRNSGNTAS